MSGVPTDIVTTRFIFNMMRRSQYLDTLKDATVGDYKWSAQSSDFSGWLKCDGRSLLRTTYHNLFTIIGTSSGSADANTFKLPDCRGRVAGSVGTGVGLTARSLGDTAGVETHVLSVGELPTHNHTGTSNAAGAHTHSSNAVGGSLGLASSDGHNTVNTVDESVGELNVYTSPQALVIDSVGDHTHGFTTDNTGSSNAVNMLQPTIFLGNVFIYSGVQEPLYPGDVIGPNETFLQPGDELNLPV